MPQPAVLNDLPRIKLYLQLLFCYYPSYLQNIGCDMIDKFKYMQLRILDDHLFRISACDRPSGGWIRAVRTSLGMSVRQMAERMDITQQSAARLEKNEADDVIKLKSLRKAAEALDCRLVYALVPNEGELRDIVRRQALRPEILLIP